MFMNFEKALRLCLILLLVPAMLWAADGKVRGVVKDAETGEALMGANVLIQGTMMGAATDENGEFIILNVPVGKYSLVATYMGYQKVTIENVIVNEGATTFQNYSVPKTVLEGQEVVILAEKPLVNRGATNDVKVLRSEAIENLPVRGYSNLAGAQVGAVQSGNTVYVRGGRADEVGYFVDGVLMNNPYNRARTGEVSQNALEEVSYQPGGMSAEYGLFNSGVVSTQTKTGGSKIAVSGEAITDQFLGYNEKKLGLGTYSYGYNLYSLAVSGPVPATSGKLRFFANAEYNYMRDRNPSWGPSVKSSGFVTDVKELVALNPDPLPLYGAKPGNTLKQWSGIGNLYLDLNQLKFKVGGNVTLDDHRDYTHDYAPFNWANMPKEGSDTYTGYAKATWVINPTAYVVANANYYLYKYYYQDALHGLDFMDYTDPSKNTNITEWGQRAAQRTEFAEFATYGRVYGTYNKQNIDRINLKLDGTWRRGADEPRPVLQRPALASLRNPAQSVRAESESEPGRHSQRLPFLLPRQRRVRLHG